MKKYISIPTFIIFFLVIISIGLIACESKGNDGKVKIDRLFEDMGVLKPSKTTEPVEINLKDMNGKEIKVSDFRGKIVFLNFWTTWCPACRVEMPSMEKLYQRFKDKDFAMIAIDLQEPASRVKNFFKKYKLSFISLLDSKGEVGGRFGIRSIPTTLILGRNGRVIGGAIGAREWDSKKSFAFFDYLVGMEDESSSKL